AEDLAALLDHLGIGRAHVLGLSLGGAIVTEFALAYPARTTALIPVDPVLWGVRWAPDYQQSLHDIWALGKTDGIEAARALWLAPPMFARALARPAVGARLSRIVGDYSGWAWTHDDPGRVPDPPAAARLEAIAAPTLAILGELDVPDFHVTTDLL